MAKRRSSSAPTIGRRIRRQLRLERAGYDVCCAATALLRQVARFEDLVKRRFPVGCEVVVRVLSPPPLRGFSFIHAEIAYYCMPCFLGVCVRMESRLIDLGGLDYARVRNTPDVVQTDWASIDLMADAPADVRWLDPFAGGEGE